MTSRTNKIHRHMSQTNPVVLTRGGRMTKKFLRCMFFGFRNSGANTSTSIWNSIKWHHYIHRIWSLNVFMFLLTLIIFIFVLRWFCAVGRFLAWNKCSFITHCRAFDRHNSISCFIVKYGADAMTLHNIWHSLTNSSHSKKTLDNTAQNVYVNKAYFIVNVLD